MYGSTYLPHARIIIMSYQLSQWLKPVLVLCLELTVNFWNYIEIEIMQLGQKWQWTLQLKSRWWLDMKQNYLIFRNH